MESVAFDVECVHFDIADLDVLLVAVCVDVAGDRESGVGLGGAAER